MDKMTFEELMSELATIVSELEKGTLSLEESVAKYQRGMDLSIECKKRLDAAKLTVLQKSAEGNSLS